MQQSLLEQGRASDGTMSNAKQPTDSSWEAAEEKRIPEDAQREKAPNKLPIQLSVWKQLILRFRFCRRAQSYQQSGYKGADDTECSELLPVSCVCSGGAAAGWLEPQLIATDAAALRREQTLSLTPFGVLWSPFPQPSQLWEERFKPMNWKEKPTSFSSSSRRVMKDHIPSPQSILHGSINFIEEKPQLFKITAQQLF